MNNFFNPKTIAVIGASSDKRKVGYAIMANLVKAGGSDRTIYPVSLSEEEIMGLRTYKSVSDIDVANEPPIDLVIIAVRADIVPSVLEDCAAKHIGNAIIISAGFREIGPAGLELENKCLEIARQKGISLLGPNCLGTIDTRTGLNASFAAQMPLPGSIAFLSQSGALGTSLLDLAIREGVGFSKFISLGNEADLTETEFLEYLKDDDSTKAILIYLEKLNDGSKFLRLVGEIAKTKPIVVLKAGRSEGGMKAVMSHTGSLAPSDAVFSGACRQAEIIAVDSIREFFNLAKLFHSNIIKPLRNLVIVTNGGGPSVVAADLIGLSRSLSLFELSEETKTALRKVLPPMAAVGNPVDIIGDALTDRYDETLKIITDLNEVDGILLILTPQMMTEVEKTAELVVRYSKIKPIIPVFLGGPTIEPGLPVLKKGNIANFHFPKDAIEALDDLATIKSVRLTQYPQLVHNEKGKCKIAEKTPSLRQIPLSLTLKILNEGGIDMPGMLISERSDLVKVISEIGKGPYVLKAISPEIIHKTDAGVVRLNISGLEEAEEAWDSIERRLKDDFPKAEVEGIFMQKMGLGKEIIIGMKKDPVFGPSILFGLGGIFTEVFRDTVIRIAPIDRETALQMMKEIKGFSILNGLSGEKSVDFEALAGIIIAISKISLAHPEIEEVDLNPVIATAEKTVVVDARVMQG